MSVRRVCVLAIGLSIASILTGCGARTALSEGRVDATDARSEDAAPKTDVTASDACTVQIKIFDLSSTVPWMDTGLDVAAGVTLTIVATGTVRYGGDPKQVVGPNGVNFDGQQFFPTAVLADAIVIALIGKIGGTHAFDTGVPIPEGAPAGGPGFVGASYGHVMTTTGRLFLGFNDQRGSFADNVGSFHVTVTIGC